MVLKRLELQGYKTFATRTEFLFNSGITAIVGPNGSGKSNIADAIRWVLGEQRQSQLRIKRTADLIFAGSGQRPQQGMAQVSITLDNSTHWLPLDYDEVTITRTVYRSGESEYTVNGVPMLSRDVIEIWEKGGLSRDSYVVIGQGLVDAALSLRPLERRVLFDAAAGTNVYQAKKQDALRKLEETKYNLMRVNDILNELSPRLARLQAQAQRAEEHAILSRDLAELLRTWFGYHWHRKRALLSEAEAQYAKAQEQVQRLQAQLDATGERLQECTRRQQELRTKAAEWQSTSRALHARIEELTRKLAVSEERERLLAAQKAELSREIALLEPQKTHYEQEVEKLSAEVARLTQERHQAELALEAAQQKWERVRKEQERLEKELKEVRREMYQAQAGVSQCQARLAQLAERRRELQQERQQTENAIAQREEVLKNLLGAAHTHTAEELTIQTAIESLLQEAAAQRSLISDLQNQNSALDAELQQTLQRISSLQGRQQALRRMRHSFGNYRSGVRSIMEAAEAGQLNGIHGPIVRLMKVPPELDAAIETALGPNLEDIVVSRWADAEAAIQYLKRTGSGRATFLPLDTLRARPDPQVPSGDGVIGLASQLIQFEAQYRTVFAWLLNRTIVVADLKVAHRLLGPKASGLRFVTLEGELVLGSGSLTGGSRRETDSRIALERDWEAIPQQLDALQAKRAALEGQLAANKQSLADLTAKLGQLEIQIGKLREDLARVSHEKGRLEQQSERIREEIAWHRSSWQRSAEQLTGLAATESDLLKQRETAEQRHLALSTKLAELEQKVASFQGGEYQQEVAAAQASLTVALRNQESQRALADTHKRSLEQISGQIASKQARSKELSLALEQEAALIQQLKKELQACQAELDELRRRMEPGEAELAKLEQQEAALRKAREQLQARHQEEEAQSQQAALEVKQLRFDLERLEAQILEELGPITLPEWHTHQLRLGLGEGETPLPEVAVLPENLEKELTDLRARLRRLGAVNPNAPDEYQEELKRHMFLSEQAADLEKASQSLRNIISELDEVMRQRFSQTFAAISHEFTNCFKALFGGGTARLSLTDPDDLDNTGIDITARPPGKRPQSLALLSGGERALTAVALLFAILKTKPLPFCVLDEVDAMLDEANVGRFCEMLTKMADNTQFIVITHNRHTINAAHTIYGISMRGDGVSVALSLRLDEAEQAAMAAAS